MTAACDAGNTLVAKTKPVQQRQKKARKRQSDLGNNIGRRRSSKKERGPETPLNKVVVG